MSTPTGAETPEWVTLREAAEITGKAVKTMRKWAVAGRVLAQKDSAGKWFVRKSDLVDTEPAAERAATIDVLSAEIVAMRETFHTLAEDLAAARERVGRAETERDGLLAREQNIETERDALRDALLAREQAAETDKLRLLAQIAELEGRRWWQRRA